MYGCTYRANGGHAYCFGAVALGVTYRDRRGIIFGLPATHLSLAEAAVRLFAREASQRAFTYLAAAVPESSPARRCVLRCRPDDSSLEVLRAPHRVTIALPP
jgi:hypothetical protein